MAWQWARDGRAGTSKSPRAVPVPRRAHPRCTHTTMCAPRVPPKSSRSANIPLTAAKDLCACLHASPTRMHLHAPACTCMHLHAPACTCIPGHACIPGHVYRGGKRVSARCTPSCSAGHATPPCVCVCTALVCMCTPCTSTCICTYMHIMYQPKHHQRRSSPCRSYSHGAPCQPPRQGASGWPR